MPLNINDLDPATRSQFLETTRAMKDPVLQEAFEKRRVNESLGAALSMARGFDPRQQSQIPEPKKAQGLWESFEAGWQTSTTGLFLRSESPDMMLEDDAPRAERLAMMAATVLGDMPTFVAGAFAGAIPGIPGGPAGVAAAGGAGAIGLTEGVRTWLLESYAQGYTKQDLSDRLAATAWATGKGVVIGAATGGAGAKVGKAVSTVTSPVGPVKPMAQTALGKFGAVTSAELATLVGVSHALEGELPDANDFLDAAIILGGLKGAIGVSGKLTEIYKRTGKTPKEVLSEAHKDPKVYQELIDQRFPAIPEKFRAAEDSPLRPTLFEPIKSTKGETPPGLNELATSPFNARMLEVREKHNLPVERLDMKDGPRAMLDQITEIYKADFQAAQGGRVSWQRTDAESMAFIREIIGEKGIAAITEVPGTVGYAARVNAIRDLTIMASNRAWEKATVIANKGKAATPEEMVDLLASFERTKALASSLRREKSEIGRALQIQKKYERNPGAKGKEKEIMDLLEQHGGKDAVETLGKLIAEINDPLAVAQLLKKPTTFEMIIEGWKAMLLSGPSTQEVNFIGNLFFAATRVPKEVVAASINKFKPGSAERVNYTDAIALGHGLVKGAFDSIRAGGEMVRRNISENDSFAKGLWESYKKIGLSEKAEQQFQPKIPGELGHVIRAPFKMLTMSDILARTMNRQASLNAEASRMAIAEGLKPLSKKYWNRVNELTRNPKEEMAARAEADALRYVFLEPGPIIKALENLRSDLPILQFVLPFLKAPGGIFREFFRMTPMAPIIKQFRADYAKGGVARDRALAEVAIGTSISVATFTLARDGVFTGGGHPDRKQRAADRQAGVQPYSVKTADGRYISINRLEPAGVLMGLAADLAMAWEVMDAGDQDKAASALMWAAVEVAQNKTWLKGISSLVNAISDPERYADSWMEQMASTVVPNFLGQTAREMDPHVREIDSILAAVQSKIPGLRESLPVVYDDFGEPVQRAQGLWPTAPSTVKQATTDKVRQEASRLGVATTGVPKSIQAGSLMGARKMEDLTREQRDVYATTSGQLAYQILSQAVNSPGWEQMPYLVQRRYFERAFMMARQQGAIAALPIEQRAAAIESIRDEYGL